MGHTKEGNQARRSTQPPLPLPPWGQMEDVGGFGKVPRAWWDLGGAPPRISPFSCRLWSGGRLMMKRLNLLFTRFFSEASGVWGAPGGTAGPGCGHGHSHASPEVCSLPLGPSNST